MQNIMFIATFIILILNLLITPFVIYINIKEASTKSYNTAIIFGICFLMNLFTVLIMSRKIF